VTNGEWLERPASLAHREAAGITVGPRHTPASLRKIHTRAIHDHPGPPSKYERFGHDSIGRRSSNGNARLGLVEIGIGEWSPALLCHTTGHASASGGSAGLEGRFVVRHTGSAARRLPFRLHRPQKPPSSQPKLIGWRGAVRESAVLLPALPAFQYYRCLGRKDADQIVHGVRQIIGGRGIDQAIGDLLVAAVNPLALEVTLDVQQELEARWEEMDRLRRTQVYRARYVVELSRRRFLRVNPENRLVAAS
jgi:hypothetical protein